MQDSQATSNMIDLHFSLHRSIDDKLCVQILKQKKRQKEAAPEEGIVFLIMDHSLIIIKERNQFYTVPCKNAICQFSFFISGFYKVKGNRLIIWVLMGLTKLITLAF